MEQQIPLSALTKCIYLLINPSEKILNFLAIDIQNIPRKNTATARNYEQVYGGESCSIDVGQYAQASYIPIQRSFHYFLSKKCQETPVLHYFLPP